MSIDNRMVQVRPAFGRARQAEAAPAPPRAPQAKAPERMAQPEAQSKVLPEAQAPIAAAQTQAFDLRRVITRTFSLMGRNTVTFLALVAAAAAPDRIAYHLLGEDNPIALLALSPLPLLCCVPLYAAVTRGALDDLNREPVTFKICMGEAMRSFFPLFAVAIRWALGISAGSLLIVPGLLLAPRWSVAGTVCIAERKDVRACFERSVTLTAAHRGPILMLVLLLAILAAWRGAEMLPVWGMPVESLPVFLLGNWLLPLLFTAFAAAGGASLYHELCLAKAEEQFA